MLNFRRLALVGISFSIITSLPVQAEDLQNNVIEKHIISPAPKAMCYSVAGHWEGTTWVDTHNVCKYENRKEGVAWINEYWSCITVAAEGTCTNWQLVPGHWVKTLE